MIPGSDWPGPYVATVGKRRRCMNYEHNACDNDMSTLCVRLYCGACCREADDGTFCPKHHLRRPLLASKEVPGFSTPRIVE